MCNQIRIGIIGDYDGRPAHIATNEAIKHGAARLGLEVETVWVSTDSLLDGIQEILQGFAGLWCAPGSPYKSMIGAINGIQFARENNYPFIGTCGGFQHAVIEYARNVFQIKEVMNDNFDPYEPNELITALSCSLIGQTRHILIDKSSKIYKTYGMDEVNEKYNCSFGLGKQFQSKLHNGGFKVVGTDEEGEARIIVLEQNQFFIATLFQPQLSSTYETPHPLIMAFLTEAKNFKNK